MFRLQCANVLLDQDWRASVSDFGLSQVLPASCTLLDGGWLQWLALRVVAGRGGAHYMLRLADCTESGMDA